MLRQTCTVAAVAHVAFVLLFASLGLPLLVWVNLGSISMFAAGRFLLSRRRNAAAVALIAGEVVAHAVLASALLGWESGFHYYLIAMVGPLAIAMRGSTFSKIGGLLAFGAGYAALDAWTRQAPPVYQIDPLVLDAIRYTNVGGMLAIMSFVSRTYYRLVTSAERALQTLASTDPLTGVYNRRRLLEIFREARPAGTGAPALFLLLCDIDHFKLFNDRHGHETGDLVLARVAAAMTSALRTTDSVARWGGEEFIVLLPGADWISAMQAGERIRFGVGALGLTPPSLDSKALPVAEPPSVLRVSITVGVARVDPNDPIDAAIARADAALYRGKAAGRNRVVAEVHAAALAVD